MIQLNLIEVLSIPIIHYVADFILQTDKEAKGKSKNWSDLLNHTITYSAVWIIPMQFMIGYNNLNVSKAGMYGLLFAVITFICHTITDYFTSRLNSKLLPPITVLKFDSNTFGDNEMLAYPKNSSWHNFFVGIGFDQYILHLPQLFLTYALLKQYL